MKGGGGPPAAEAQRVSRSGEEKIRKINVFQNPLTTRIVEFLTAIGIEVVAARLEGECFRPRILVERGRLYVDETKLTYPGDLLHEAGHLAIAPSSMRPGLGGEVVIPGADMSVLEVQVTAWAYAAIVHLNFDPKILFTKGATGESLRVCYLLLARECIRARTVCSRRE